MNKTPITLIELQDILNQEQQEYDLARIVNPYACSTVELENGTLRALDTCHHIWGHDHRCSNCFSRRACIQGKVLYKSEIMGKKNYRIKSAPYRVIMEDGEVRNMVIESIRITDLAEEKVNSSIAGDVKTASTDYIFNEAKTGVIHLNSERKVTYANREAKNMLLRGGEEEAFRLSTIISNWLEGLQDSENPSLLFTQRYEYDHRDYFFDVQLIPFRNDDRQDMIVILHEHTDREAREIARVRDQDSLTGLYNESGFMLAMSRLLQDHPDREYVHIRLSVKNFSLFSSVFGIRTADALLLRIAGFLRNLTEESGCACRFHGDEFGALLEKDYLDKKKIALDLNRIKEDVDTQNFSLIFQMGICEIESPRPEPEIICDRASIAMRHVRSRGDNIAFSVYSDSMTVEELTDSQLLARFEQAILRDEFQMYLQAQTTSDGRVKSAEALVRWIRPGEGVIQPLNFIPQLEANGMIYRMDRIIWEKAARQLAAWQGTPFERLRISVNVSAADIALTDVAATFDALAEKYGINPDMLSIEITETAMVRDPDLLLRTIDRLHRRGFQVEIDDFGSGYSSLKLLKDMNADVLKIDREFLANTIHEQKMKTILSSVIHMADQLNMNVITEGVETREMVDMLSEMGCGLFQGFLFSKPVPVDEFMDTYKDLLA